MTRFLQRLRRFLAGRRLRDAINRHEHAAAQLDAALREVLR